MRVTQVESGEMKTDGGQVRLRDSAVDRQVFHQFRIIRFDYADNREILFWVRASFTSRTSLERERAKADDDGRGERDKFVR